MRFLFVVLLFSMVLSSFAAKVDSYEFSFEELSKMIYTSASLTETSIKDAPASITLISEEMIQNSVILLFYSVINNRRNSGVRFSSLMGSGNL